MVKNLYLYSTNIHRTYSMAQHGTKTQRLATYSLMRDHSPQTDMLSDPWAVFPIHSMHPSPFLLPRSTQQFSAT